MHIQFTHEQHLECNICARVLNGRGSLRYHLSTFHDLNNDDNREQPLFSCEVCEKTFNNAAAVRMHKKYVHASERIECELCGKHYKFQYLKTHM